MVKFQRRSAGCRAVSVGRSVADSLFRPHPEQRARASREPKLEWSSKAYNLRNRNEFKLMIQTSTI